MNSLEPKTGGPYGGVLELNSPLKFAESYLEKATFVGIIDGFKHPQVDPAYSHSRVRDSAQPFVQLLRTIGITAKIEGDPHLTGLVHFAISWLAKNAMHLTLAHANLDLSKRRISRGISTMTDSGVALVASDELLVDAQPTRRNRTEQIVKIL